MREMSRPSPNESGVPRWVHDPERLCRSIVDQAVVGVVQADLDGRMVFVNQEWCRMTGYAEHELLGRNVLDLTDDESQDSSHAALAALCADGAPLVLEKEYRRKDGSLLHARTSCNGLTDASGRVVGLTAVVVDIGDAVAAQAALRRSERRYRELFEAIEEGFCVVEMLFDAAGQPCDYRYLEANPAFERETGLRDVVGRTMRELAPGHEHQWFEVYGEVARSGRP